MKNVKKIVAIIIILILTLSQLTGFCEELEDVAVGGNIVSDNIIIKDEEIDFLSRLGIIDQKFDMNNGITRLDATIMISKMLKLDPLTVVYFNDLPETQANYGYVSTLAKVGIISVGSDRMFYPNRLITYPEMITMLVKTAGYYYVAESQGGYPIGYINAANQIGLSKGIKNSDNNKPDNKVFIKLLINLLDVNTVVETISAGNSSYNINKDQTFSEKFLNLYNYKGVVTATEITSVFGKSQLKDNTIELTLSDNTKVQLDSKAIHSNHLLGLNVQAYTKELDNDNTKELFYITIIDHKNQITNITDLQLTSFTSSKIEYRVKEDDSTTKIVKLSPTTSYIYNGQYYFGEMDSKFNSKNGEIISIDNTNDGIADVVFLWEYNDIVISQISQSTFSVVDKYSGHSLELNKISDDYFLNLTYDNIEINLENLSEWDVLSVAISENTSDKYVITAKLSRTTISGVVQEVINDADKAKLLIEQKYYNLSSHFKGIIKSSDEGSFYVNCLNKIVGFNKNIMTNRNYAYLISMAIDSGVSGNVKLQIFTSDSQMLILPLANKVNYNGQSVYANTLMDSIDFKQKTPTGEIIEENGAPVFNHQLITYALNDKKEIRQINTATEPKEPSEIPDSQLTLNSINAQAAYRNTFLSFGGEALLSNDTVTFYIEMESDATTGSNKITDTKRLRIVPYKGLEDGISYDTSIYDCDINKFAKAVVIKQAVGGVEKLSDSLFSRSLFVFSKKSQVFIDEETRVIIKGYHSGVEVSFLLSKENLADNFEFGDILQMWQNREGEITHYERAFSLNENPAANPNNKPILTPDKPGNNVWNGSTANTSDPLGALSFYLGNVSSKYELVPYVMNLKMPFPNANSSPMSRPFIIDNNTKVTKINKKTNQISSATKEDILISDSKNYLTFLNIRYGAVRDVVLIER